MSGGFFENAGEAVGHTLGMGAGGVIGADIGLMGGGVAGGIAGLPTGPGELVTIPAGAVAGGALGAGVGAKIGGDFGAQKGKGFGRYLDQKYDEWTRANKKADGVGSGDQSKCGANCMAADKAPGKPAEKDGYKEPKKGDGKKVKNPNGSGSGWPDAKGDVWVPTGPPDAPLSHGGSHWDVQSPGGGYRNVYPGGRVR